MNPAEHHEHAEQLAKDAYVQHWQEQDNATAHALAAIAQVHATLAAVAVDPREVEDLRGKVLVMKDALDRARADATELADRLAQVENLPEHVVSLVARHRTPARAERCITHRMPNCAFCPETWLSDAEWKKRTEATDQRAKLGELHAESGETSGEGR